MQVYSKVGRIRIKVAKSWIRFNFIRNRKTIVLIVTCEPGTYLLSPLCGMFCRDSLYLLYYFILVNTGTYGPCIKPVYFLLLSAMLPHYNQLFSCVPFSTSLFPTAMFPATLPCLDRSCLDTAPPWSHTGKFFRQTVSELPYTVL